MSGNIKIISYRDLIGHIHGLPGLIVADHRLRTRHDAAAHGDLALVHGFTTPVRDQVPIDIDDLATLGGQQDRHQPRRSLDTFKLAEKWTQGRRLLALPNQCRHRVLVSVEGTETFDPE